MVELSREKLLTLILLIVLFIIGGGLYIWQGSGQESIVISQGEIGLNNAQSETLEKKQPAEFKKIVVHVTGAVRKRGVYELPDEARVFDALEAAGGETAEADLDSINLAAYIYDGDKVYIPFIMEELNQQNSFQAGYDDGKININSAGVDELTQLTGIGPSKANSIIDYRKKNGPFRNSDELLEISGIGPKTLDKIRDQISVR